MILSLRKALTLAALSSILTLTSASAADSSTTREALELIALSLDCPIKGAGFSHEQCKFTGNQRVFQIACSGIFLNREDDRPIGGSTKYNYSKSVQYHDIEAVGISRAESGYQVHVQSKCRAGTCLTIPVPVCDSQTAANLKSALESLIE